MMESYNLIAIFPVGYPEEDAKPSHLHTTRKSEDEFIETPLAKRETISLF